MFKRFFLFVGLCAGAWGASAQTHEIGLAAGVAHYRGDMSPIINITEPAPHGAFFYRFNPNEVISLRATVAMGQIKGADSHHPQDIIGQARNHAFLTGIFEVSGQLEYNFLNFGFGTMRRPQPFSPYVLMGIGAFKLDPMRNISPAYSTWGMCVPLGLGGKWSLSPKFQLNLEFGARFTNTDNLDDLGTQTGSPAAALNAKLQGNPNNKDMYFFTNFSISYIFRNKRADCPIKM